MVVDINGLERAMTDLGGKFKTDLSFTVEVWYIPGVGTKHHATFWVKEKGTKKSDDLLGLLTHLSGGPENIEFDKPN